MEAAALLCRQLYDMKLDTSLPDLLRRQVEVQPNKIGVVSGGAKLTFRELAEQASRLGGALSRLGASRDVCVGLYVEPSLDLVIGVWGILHAGGAYLPLAPDYPEERLRYMLEDSRTTVVLTQSHLLDRLRGLAPQGTRIITLDDVLRSGDDVARDDGSAEDDPVAGNLAYVIYTSGSTGRPKGVMIENRSIVSQMQWLCACGHLGPGIRILQKTPMSFDAAQWEILAPAIGGTVVVGSPGLYRDPDALIGTIQDFQVTALQGVPTLLQALLDTGRFRECGSLRRVFSGGEALSWKLARNLFDELPWCSLINLYGPTECTINATAYRLGAKSVFRESGSVPIGVPVDNTQCYILDETMAPVEFGQTGELYIGGVQLARGYLNRPDLTQERFVPSPFMPGNRLYRTGDLASWNLDGTIHFSGRADNQVKLRGYRVELEEIALAIEKHPWVRRAAAIVTDDVRTGHRSLVACIELNPKEAAIMDQGHEGNHHLTKENKLQVKAQLSYPGLRGGDELEGRGAFRLSGAEETPAQRQEAFSRKTYRFYEGGPVTKADILSLLAPQQPDPPPADPDASNLEFLGKVLRWFGPFFSPDRLLPKYAYASPGALYATQMYLDCVGIGGLEDGVHYFHPVDHSLVRVASATLRKDRGLTVHFIGRKSAIEPVYKNNIREVLEIETGHMLGVFEEVLAGYGLGIRPAGHDVRAKDLCDVREDDDYLGSFDIVPYEANRLGEVDFFVQTHGDRVADLPEGTYRVRNGQIHPVSKDIVLPKHVIAINQQVYERSSFGLAVISRIDVPWLQYIVLGLALHRFQRNGLGLGFMSSGYSSKSGNPLPASWRIDDILRSSGIESGPLYFFLGGKVSEEQRLSEGMQEDLVHMQGPAEMIRDELSTLLPAYMIPNKALIFDQLPLTASGKIDNVSLAVSEAVRAAGSTRPYVAPSTPVERWLAETWGTSLKYENVSADDDFFEAGGNSLTAVSLVGRINRHFGVRLPVQVVFECPRLSDLARRIETGAGGPLLRFVRLNDQSGGRPIFCWPGLGGYPMSLRLLGRTIGLGRPFFGVQSHGINAGEAPYRTIGEMATADIAELRHLQPEGPYTLWGYSFGARVAFETAWQLEQLGQKVDQLILICPGNPKIRQAGSGTHGRIASFANPSYVVILFSVFSGNIDTPDLDACLDRCRDEDSFVDFVLALYPELDAPLARRIVRIVGETYEFEYSFRELAERQLKAPVTIFKAQGDDYSFIEARSGYSAEPPTVIELECDHYAVLKAGGVEALAAAVEARQPAPHAKG